MSNYTFYYKITNEYQTHYNSISKWNAKQIYNYFTIRGWSDAAIAGLLGNIESESYINPGQVQYGYSTSGGDGGCGFIQWTPQTVIRDWASARKLKWYDGTAQCKRINQEMNGKYNVWFSNNGYNYTREQFKKLTSVDEATAAYFWERERGTWSDVRYTYAEYYYTYITGSEIPDEPTDSESSTSDSGLEGLMQYWKKKWYLPPTFGGYYK